MKKIYNAIALFLLTISFPLSAKESDASSIPQWIRETVQRELQSFEKGFDNASLLRHFREKKDENLVFFRIRKGKIHYFRYRLNDCKRFQQIKKTIFALNKKQKLPDMVLIISLDDSYDQSSPVPIMTFAKHQSANAILIPDFEALGGYGDVAEKVHNHQILWEEKSPIAFFRGSATGIKDPENWRESPRPQMAFISQKYERFLDAKITSSGLAVPIGVLKREKIHASPVSIEKHLQFRYLLDIDGDSCGYSRCYWILLSDCLMMKVQSPNIQWYYSLLKPYENYLPIKEDLSDVIQQIRWARKNDELCQKMAQKATTLAKTHLTQEKTLLYLDYLLRNYAKFNSK